MALQPHLFRWKRPVTADQMMKGIKMIPLAVSHDEIAICSGEESSFENEERNSHAENCL
jgi:hypothetical protein